MFGTQRIVDCVHSPIMVADTPVTGPFRERPDFVILKRSNVARWAGPLRPRGDASSLVSGRMSIPTTPNSRGTSQSKARSKPGADGAGHPQRDPREGDRQHPGGQEFDADRGGVAHEGCAVASIARRNRQTARLFHRALDPHARAVEKPRSLPV